MGEIGIDRHEFLYELKLWEINSIVEGYRRRARAVWDASRWQTWLLLCSMGAKGLHRPEDLQLFTWDEEEDCDVMTKEDVEALQREMAAINEQLKRHEEDRQDNSPLL